jgi:D-glutamate N-acetyltransferase
MPDILRIQLRKPYLILVGDEGDPTYAKTGLGIVQWRRADVAGQLRMADAAVDLGVPAMDIDEAVQRGVGSLLIGVAPIGGKIPDAWWELMYTAADAGLDVVAGLHTRLNDNPTLVAAAKRGGAQLIDVRVPPKSIPVGTGRRRSGRRLLTVGTDCAIGKKYTALALEVALREAGFDVTYRATGQTGIMIAGEGMPIDAVVADFISGAAEVLSPANAPDHWDVIEGQGSLFHPAYSGVSLGLLHGSQPDAIVVCHDATRQTVSGWEHFALPSLEDCIELHRRMAQRTNPDARVVGLSVNTQALPPESRAAWLAELSGKHGIPAVDPLIDGCGAIVAHLGRCFGQGT